MILQKFISKKLKDFLLVPILICGSILGYSQNMKISGNVLSSKDKMPLPGVNVLIEGSQKGVVTDFDGFYSIDVVSDKSVLVFSYLGYKTKKIAVGKLNKLDVSLDEDLNKLDEVVVVGYGLSSKRDLTSSISILDVDDLKTAQTPQFEQMLTGRVAGVDVSNLTSEPGAGLSIRIRGSNSINGDNSPLLVIDGVLGGSFESLNMNDVESMQVLKDASATAIYGSQGANGVIIITTKSGKSEALQVELFGNSGIQRVTKRLNLLTAEEHIQVLVDDPNFDFPSEITGITNPILTGKGTDWQDVIFQDASYNNYHLTLRGGSDRLSAFMSLDFLDQEGVVKNSDYNKLSARTDIKFNASDNLGIRYSTSAYKTTSNQVKTNEGYGSFGGPVTINAGLFSPIVPIYAEDGSFNNDLSNSFIRDNPAAILANLDDLYETNYLQNTIQTRWKLSKNITHDFLASHTNSTFNRKRYTGKVLLSSFNRGEAYLDNIERDAWQIKNTLTYNKTFSKAHKFSVLAGQELSEDNRFRTSVTAQGFATETSKYNNIGLADEVTGFFSERTSWGLASFFTRVTYGFKSKYLFALSARADGSTKFAENNKWGYFPSGSFAWVASEESFLKDSKLISYLKLRTSYGETGSQAINPYQSLAAYSTGINYSNGSQDLFNGAFVSRIANPNLKWETTAQYDAGIDLKLIDGKLGITGDYYRKVTSDLLYEKRLLAYTGIESQIQNIGKMENVGYEFSLDAIPFDGKFKWDISANISFTKNKVLDLGDNTDVFFGPPSGSRGSGFTTSGVLRVGEPIGNFYGYVADGIFKTQEDLDAIDQPGAVLGRVRYKDISGPDGIPDGKIDDNDRKIIGNALPDYIFGVTNNFSYGNFDFNVTFQGVMGKDGIRFDKGKVLTKEKFEGWSVNNPESNIPTNGDLGSVTNSNYVEDASYIKFKNISLGYNFNKDILSKLGVKSMKLYFSAVDAIVITKYSGYNPEVNSFAEGNTFQKNAALGYDSGAYPGVSQYLLGLNIAF